MIRVGVGYALKGQETPQPPFRPKTLAGATRTSMGRPIGSLPLPEDSRRAAIRCDQPLTVRFSASVLAATVIVRL